MVEVDAVELFGDDDQLGVMATFSGGRVGEVDSDLCGDLRYEQAVAVEGGGVVAGGCQARGGCPESSHGAGGAGP
ncbi:hypothetical protein BL254_10730 [Protofrankia sp. BMG5.30]|uniref:Uncharacterized protein n=1 Tax=Protofrankia coriariae TaxID=1562887 RepID=A0ABR5F4J3_9ACTN|nr:hypothetical protein FrCorBMG51_11335 [Protofrankia coriariae]ONH35749.1 hypothetical protein BL254_10730 [Protofrankia sp. BMG5.30]